MSDLGRGLSIAIGKATLAKHIERCKAGCQNGQPCNVAIAHRETLAALSTPPETGGTT